MTDRPRGFALLTPEQHAEISGRGGRAAHAKGRAHKWTAEEAAEAGAKGGLAVAEKYGSEHMKKIASNGGKKRAQRRAAA